MVRGHVKGRENFDVGAVGLFPHVCVSGEGKEERVVAERGEELEVWLRHDRVYTVLVEGILELMKLEIESWSSEHLKGVRQRR